MIRGLTSTPVVGGLLGGLAMTACLGPLVVPTNYEWLMHGDYGLHFLGWHLYRHGPWTLPIGATPLLIWPVGSSIGLTDSIPILAFVFKALDPLLPPVFQFIGLWLVLAFVLQGVFGALLMRLATPRRSLQLLGAALLILSPPLIYRINHAALTSHWILLASLWLSFRHDADVPSARLAGAWAALCAVSAATQPYTLFMVVILMLAAHGRQVVVAPPRVVRIAAHAGLALAASWVSLWQSGSLMIPSTDGLEIGGFGVWSANLLTFIMPTEGPTFFSPGPFPYEHREQYEGYAYLGAGMLLLAVFVIAARARSGRRPRWSRRSLRCAPFTLALIFLTVMALGPQVTAGSHTLFTYARSWWGPLTVFRTSGRMIWPLYYATVVGVLFAATRLRYRTAVVACSLALGVQAADLAGMVGYVRDVRAYGFRDPLQSRFWREVPRHYDQMVLIPSNLCSHEALDFLPFALHAGTYGLGINSGITARYDVRKARAYCHQLEEEIDRGLPSDRSLYVVRLDLLPEVKAQATAQLLCTALDHYGVCFTAASFARWGGAFDLPRSRLPDNAELLRFYDALNETYRTTLGRGAREANGPTGLRVESLARYLAYRIEGCDHALAERRALQLQGPREVALCPSLVLHHELPPADQTYAFFVRLSEALREKPAPAASSTHVDPEGEAVWLQAYMRERARGAREPDARATVLAAIAGPR